MNHQKTIIWIVGFCCPVLFLTACGPSQVALDSTATVAAAALFSTQTAGAPTPTPTATLTPTQTPIPTPTTTLTPTQTPIPTTTPTPTPQPDPIAMIAWRELQLPADFQAISPDDFGIGNGAPAYTLQTGGGSTVSATVEGSFVFIDGDRAQVVYGYTVNLPTKTDRDTFDALLTIYPDYLRSALPNADVNSVSVGALNTDTSAGATATNNLRGIASIGFRTGPIGAFVFVQYPLTGSPVVEAEKLARVYAQSIRTALHSCTLVSITPATPAQGATWPSYDFVAEGFYPGEPQAIALEGGVQIGGETKHVVTALAGLNGGSADSQGQIAGSITFGEVKGENVSPPSELTFSIEGMYSQCSVIQSVMWPGN